LFFFFVLGEILICVGIFFLARFFLLLFSFAIFCFFMVYSLAEEKKAEGNAYYKVKDYRKALACYTRAIELCPEIVAYYGNRAACRMMMGSYQDALEDARESTRLDSGFAKGYVRIAKCCLALGDTAAALNAVNKAEELDPNSDLTNEKRSLHALQQLGEEMIKSNAKGDYRKVIPKSWCFCNVIC
jgi:tetratricopeptide (TPR) repeat protein